MNNNNEQVVQQPRNCVVEFICKNRNLLIGVLVVVALCVLLCDFNDNNKSFNLNGGGNNTAPRITNLLNPISSQSDFRFSL